MTIKNRRSESPATWTILLEGLGRGFIEIFDIESAITELGAKRHKLKNTQAADILKAAKQGLAEEFNECGGALCDRVVGGVRGPEEPFTGGP